MNSSSYWLQFEPDFRKSPWLDEWQTDPDGSVRLELVMVLRIKLVQLGLITNGDRPEVSDRFKQTIQGICTKHGFCYPDVEDCDLFRWLCSYLPLSHLQIINKRYQQLAKE